ncbi:hypothetical protein EDC01DRAFT_446918 [Geopyxis carbonaria]|nr:hypothetical protein EDC01DRAFT_446918 [Geopyxis carbonaria]
MLIEDFQDLHDAVVSGSGNGNGYDSHSQQSPTPPQPLLSFAGADVLVTTPLGTYELTSSTLSQASEFFDMSMSERWNRDSSPERDTADMRFRYWLPLDGYLVDRNRVNYKNATPELLLNAHIIDTLLRVIYGLPVALTLDSCATLIEAADAYDCLPSITAQASSYWSSLPPADLGDAIRLDPWLFLLTSFQIQHSTVFDSALAHCVGIWHALPASQHRLASTPSADLSTAFDDVLWLLSLPDALQTVIHTQSAILSATVATTTTALSTIAAAPVAAPTSSLDALDFSFGWSTAAPLSETLARRVTRDFIATGTSTGGTGFRALHAGLRTMPDEFFATPYFSMHEHAAALRKIHPAYEAALLELAGEYHDPDLMLQVHRFHQALRGFLDEVKVAVEALAVDCSGVARAAAGTGAEADCDYLLCARIDAGTYPWRPAASRKRRPSYDELRRSTRRVASEDVLFIKGTAVC